MRKILKRMPIGQCNVNWSHWNWKTTSPRCSFILLGTIVSEYMRARMNSIILTTKQRHNLENFHIHFPIATGCTWSQSHRIMIIFVLFLCCGNIIAIWTCLCSLYLLPIGLRWLMFLHLSFCCNCQYLLHLFLCAAPLVGRQFDSHFNNLKIHINCIQINSD